jgi:Uncharacterized conserved domain (SAYSvFN)
MVDGGVEEEDEALLALTLPAAAPAWQHRVSRIMHQWAYIPEPVFALLFSIRIRSWALLIAWITMSRVAAVYEAGPPFLVCTVLTLIFVNLGTRREGLSGYSLFNPGVQRLPGQVTAEDIDGAMRRGHM